MNEIVGATGGGVGGVRGHSGGDWNGVRREQQMDVEGRLLRGGAGGQNTHETKGSSSSMYGGGGKWKAGDETSGWREGVARAVGRAVCIK